MNDLSFSRRQAIGALSVGVAAVALPASRVLAQAPAGEAQVTALLDSIGENLLALSPEGATSLGLDTGARAVLRSRLADRSQAGQDRLAAVLRTDLARAEAVDTAALSHSTRTSVEVVRSAYRTALEGFAQPYGDVAVGGWRNTPYVVIQNVGAYLDVPKFLDTDHVVKNADNVGERFPNEARKMHYGDIEHRPIYGEASADEAKSLIDEGIEVMPLPTLPEDRN